MSEDGRGEMEKKMMEKGERLLVVQGGMEEWYARSSLFVLFLCWFDGLWSKVFDLGKI